MRSQRWQHAVILVIAMWLISSPYLFPSYDAAGAAPVWTSHLVGAVLLVLAVVSLVKPRRWLDWASLAVGCWLIVAPLVLDFSNMTGIAMANHLIAGTAVGLDALAAIALHRDDLSEPYSDQC